jgi:titin
VAITWAEPTSNGGAAISDYEITACVGGQCFTVNDDESLVRSLTLKTLGVGLSYTFMVAAKNVAGTGNNSDPSAPVVPRQLPDAPTKVQAKPNNTGGVVVEWWRCN